MSSLIEGSTTAIDELASKAESNEQTMWQNLIAQENERDNKIDQAMGIDKIKGKTMIAMGGNRTRDIKMKKKEENTKNFKKLNQMRVVIDEEQKQLELLELKKDEDYVDIELTDSS